MTSASSERGVLVSVSTLIAVCLGLLTLLTLIANIKYSALTKHETQFHEQLNKVSSVKLNTLDKKFSEMSRDYNATSSEVRRELQLLREDIVELKANMRQTQRQTQID